MIFRTAMMILGIALGLLLLISGCTSLVVFATVGNTTLFFQMLIFFALGIFLMRVSIRWGTDRRKKLLAAYFLLITGACVLLTLGSVVTIIGLYSSGMDKIAPDIPVTMAILFVLCSIIFGRFGVKWLKESTKAAGAQKDVPAHRPSALAANDAGITAGRNQAPQDAGAVSVRSAPPRSFPVYTGSGNCDVCNSAIHGGDAYQVPTDVFYSSEKYKKQMDALSYLTGMSGEQFIRQMRANDKTASSAVCKNCISLFQ